MTLAVRCSKPSHTYKLHCDPTPCTAVNIGVVGLSAKNKTDLYFERDPRRPLRRFQYPCAQEPHLWVKVSPRLGERAEPAPYLIRG
jgi:hypothetical protein